MDEEHQLKGFPSTCIDLLRLCRPPMLSDAPFDSSVSCRTTCRSEWGLFTAISARQKEARVNKNETSILEGHNAVRPPIPCSLSLPTSHPLRVSRPAFMFKDYLLIQNVQGHETEEKRNNSRGGRKGMAWLYLFIGFHINPLEHGAVCASFPGMCECFRAIKRKTEFSMDSM